MATPMGIGALISITSLQRFGKPEMAGAVLSSFRADSPAVHELAARQGTCCACIVMAEDLDMLSDECCFDGDACKVHAA